MPACEISMSLPTFMNQGHPCRLNLVHGYEGDKIQPCSNFFTVHTINVTPPYLSPANNISGEWRWLSRLVLSQPHTKKEKADTTTLGHSLTMRQISHSIDGIIDFAYLDHKESHKELEDLIASLGSRAMDLYARGDFDDPFWRRHFEPDVRVEYDGLVGVGMDTFFELEFNLPENPTDIRVSLLSNPTGETGTSIICSPVTFIYVHKFVTDGLAREASVSATWGLVGAEWKCSAFTIASGIDFTLFGL